MILKADDDGCYTVSFLLLPEYAMVALLAAIEPMRVVNRLSGATIFRWQLLTENQAQVAASNEMSLQQSCQYHSVPAPKNLFVCASFNPEKYLHKTTVKWLQSLEQQKAVLGALDTGCYLLAAAGLLKKHKATLHWEAVPDFVENYPEVEISNELFEIDRQRVTCAGGNAAMDMMLHIIQQQLGDALAISVCEQFIHSGLRKKTDKQRMNVAARLNIHHPRLLKVLLLMEQTLHKSLSASYLADQAHLSLRQLERLFQLHLQHTPKSYHLMLRLNHGQKLLRESEVSITEISQLCGFSSGSHFSRCYRQQFQCNPTDTRNSRQ